MIECKFSVGDGVRIPGFADHIGIVVATLYNPEMNWWDCYIDVLGKVVNGRYFEYAGGGLRSFGDRVVCRYLDSSCLPYA